MNKNKLIFWVVWIVIVILLILFMWLVSKWKSSQAPWAKATVKIWTLNDDQANFKLFLDTFKQKNTQYQNVDFEITSFTNYQEYFYSLIWSFLIWSAPDIFVLNNNDSWFFDNQILPLENSNISIDAFRQNFEPVFSNDLIWSVDLEWQKLEYLRWIPLWYESLWIFYNFLYLKWKKLNTWSYVNDAISTLKNNNWFQTILWLWNGSTVYEAWDIFTQMLLLDNISWVGNIDTKTLQSVIWTYFKFGDINQDNWYNYYFEDLLKSNSTNLDLFSKWELQMIIGYPSLLNEIDKRWYNKNFLRATNFPTYSEKSGKLLVNYNYFVINKNTSYPNFAKELLWYFSSQEAQEKYAQLFPFYQSPNLEASKIRLEQNLKEWYFIKYKDFYNSNLEFSSFNKWYKVIYDSELPNILDKWFNWLEIFENFKKRLLCLSDKMISQQDLWTPCKF